MDLVGPDGLLAGVTKRVLETGLEVDRLGYDKHAVEGPQRRQLPQRHPHQDGAGRDPFELDASRDRDGTFESQTVKKRQRRLTGVDEMVISLCARKAALRRRQADRITIYASKTIAVPLEVLFDGCVNPRSRRKWLMDGTMSLGTSQPGHTARFNWGDGSTRVSVSFVDKGPAKATVAVAHERLPDPDEAETAKAS